MPSPDADRRRLLAGLDRAQGKILRFYRTLLWACLLVVLAALAFIVLRWSGPGTGSQGEWFYFGIGAVLLVGWLLSRLEGARRWERAPASASVRRPLVEMERSDDRGRTWRLNLPHAPPGEEPVVESRREDGGRFWSFRFGTPAEADGRADDARIDFSRSFGVPLATLPLEVLPDAAALDRLEAELARGADLASACAAVQPAYRDWDLMARRAYRLLVERELEERRRARSGEAPHS